MVLAINGTPVFVNTTTTSNSMTLTDTYMAQYPFTKVNPTTGTFTPFVELTHYTRNTGLQKTEADLWMTQTPGQSLDPGVVDSNAGILVNSYALNWPNRLNTTTIQNPFGDTAFRNLIHTGSVTHVSDPELKEEVVDADLDRCYDSIRTLPLHRYSYIQPYREAFQIQDRVRLGLLTTEVETQFPNSVTTVPFGDLWPSGPSSIQTLSLGQIRYAHIGATKALSQRVSHLRSTIQALKEEIYRVSYFYVC
jgi:hypothetical protein